MEEAYWTLYKGGSGEITEKKSRFIADLTPVSTEEEALAFIESVRKKYWDARHHCFAYRIGKDNRTLRASDDGEPSQTAGKPMMDVLEGQQLHNVCAVVTRYFGGTLLGTGGLVRAYTDATKAAIEAADIVTVSVCVDIVLEVPYGLYEQLCRVAEGCGAKLAESDFAENVLLTFRMLDGTQASFLEKLTELTRGQSEIIVTEPFDAAF